MINSVNYAIIAAGDGSRLVKEGIKTPKPLIEVNGEKLIERLIRIFSENNAGSINVIINSYMKDVEVYLKEIQHSYNVNVIVKSTESSMHSFYELSKIMGEGKFCMTTVDTIFPEKEFAKYISDFISCNDTDGSFAVTDFIDDESPLYVGVNSDNLITGFYDERPVDYKYISGGIYCLDNSCFQLLDESIKSGKSRMRNFQRALIDNNFRIKAFPFTKIVDVDHASDIKTAEEFLRLHI